MKDNKKAFPHIEIRPSEPAGTHKKIYHQGLDLRDYFAAKAMQGIVSSDEAFMHADNYEKEVSEWCYKIADAMIEARK